MSGFNNDNEEPNPSGYVFEDQILTEVEIDDLSPPDDDDESITENVIAEEMEEELLEANMFADSPDLSFFCFREHTDSVYCMAIHPTQPGVVITGGGDDTAYIWKYVKQQRDENTSTLDATGPLGEIVSSIKLVGHTDTVTSVGFNFNGTLALTGGYDGIVRIWQVATGELIQVLEGPEDIEWAQWHNKGNAVIAGSRDGTMWMWLTHNGQCVHVFAGHDGAVSCGSFTKDGKMICTGGEDGTVRQWMPKTGACRHVFDAIGGGHETMVTCVASGGDGDLLLTGSADGTVKLFQLSGKRVLQTFIHSVEVAPTVEEGLAMDAVREEEEGYNSEDEEGVRGGGESVLGVECVGFANGDTFKYAASGGLDKTLKVWDILTGSLRSTCVHGGSVVALKWHSMGVTGGGLPAVCTAALDNAVRLWDGRNGALLMLLTGHTDLVTSIDMAPYIAADNDSNLDGDNSTDVIVSVSDDKTARVFMINMNALFKI